jgi:hypothetical protein
MSRHFRPWKIDQVQLLPPAIGDYVPGDHLAQFVVALAREHLDLSEIVASYKSGLGQFRRRRHTISRSLSETDCEFLAPVRGSVDALKFSSGSWADDGL